MLIDRDDVSGTRDLQHVDDGRAGGAGAVLDDLDILDALANDLQGVEHTCQHDDGGAVLIVMEHRDLKVAFKLCLDLKALRAADILKVDAAEGRRNGLDRCDDLLLCLGVQADGERIDTAELLEKHALALHDRQTGLGADVAQPQHGGAVGDHGHGAALHRVGVDIVGICLDLAAGLSYAGGVGGGQRIAVLTFAKALYGDLAGEFAVEFKRCFVIVHGDTSPYYIILLSVMVLGRGRTCPARSLAAKSLWILC